MKIDFMSKLLKKKGNGISILVPLHITKSGGRRLRNWEWLKKYWEINLPGAQIIVGEDPEAETLPFSKSVAVNNAASKALGDVFVIVDADGYISAEAIIYCAEEIRLARTRNHKLWFMPYRNFYRLTEKASDLLLESDPSNPYKFSIPPSDDEILNKGFYQGNPESEIASWYGALIQIVPREAFIEVGGWDTRFRGWGGEDHAAMRATDTLYWAHKTIPVSVFHLWHPVIISTSPDSPNKDRMWEKQESASKNHALSGRYYWASWNKKRMRGLVNEFKESLSPVPEIDPPTPEELLSWWRAGVEADESSCSH